MPDYFGLTVDPLTQKVRPGDLPIGVAGGVAGLNPQGLVTHADGTVVGGGVGSLYDAVLDGSPTATTPPDDDDSTRVANTTWVANRPNSIENLAPGSRWVHRCIGDVQPLRSTITTRTDISIDFEKLTRTNTSAGYMIDGDRWIPAPW